MENETIYVPIDTIPIFGFKQSDNRVEVQDFYFTALVLNNLIPTGKWYLCLLWICTAFIIAVLSAAVADIILFLIIRNFFRLLWKILTDTADGIIGRFFKVIGIAAGLYLVFIFIYSGVWKEYQDLLVKWLGF